MVKTCTSCHLEKRLSDFSIRNKKPISWCKSCVATKTRRWYWSNRQKALENAKEWVSKNRHRSNEIKKKWELKNKEYRNEWLREYRKNHPEIVKNYSKKYRANHKEKIAEIQRSYMRRQKLNIWLKEIDKPIVKSAVARDCDTCGMPTMKCDLYIFDDRYTCSSCLNDFKDTSLIPRKIILAKVECPKCGREHPDRRFHNVCVDCRVLERKNATRGYYQPIFVDMGRFPEID